MSIWWICHLLDRAMIKKQSYGCWFDYKAKSLWVIYVNMLMKSFGNKPSFVTLEGTKYLFFNPHLQPMGLISDGGEVRVQVWLTRKASYSACIVATQLEILRASLSIEKTMLNYVLKTRGLKIPDLPLVIMG